MRLFILIFSLFYLANCSGPEILSDPCLSGQVLNRISCTGPTWTIRFSGQINEQTVIDTLATSTLPDEFKNPGAVIYFYVAEPEKPQICTTDFIPPKYRFDVFNVSLKKCINDKQE